MVPDYTIENKIVDAEKQFLSDTDLVENMRERMRHVKDSNK